MAANLKSLIQRAYAGFKGKKQNPGAFSASGIGCHLELKGNQLRIVKGGALGLIASALGYEGGFAERTIRVSDISAIEIDSPLLMFKYMRFSYPGASQPSGHPIRDMLAENAVIMSLIDNRQLYALKDRIERSMNAAPRG